MTQPLQILVILGSVREGRVAAPVGNWVMEQGAGLTDIALELVDPKDWALPPYPFPKPPAAGGYTDPLQLAWAEKIAGADGYILIAPEYNHGIPAVLKNALDFVYAEWVRKPLGFVGYGGAGGARSIEGLTQVARSLQMVALEAGVHIMGVNGKIADGRFTGEPHDTGSLARLFDQLAWWGTTLKAAR
ncbi:MAG: NAD(P)H-dependent oxidoreductase [Novosphingobium sp.]|nr:NAD(P)H-dependent oxidoreductase [Novosphingobium sp.]